VIARDAAGGQVVADHELIAPRGDGQPELPMAQGRHEGREHDEGDQVAGAAVAGAGCDEERAAYCDKNADDGQDAEVERSAEDEMVHVYEDHTSAEPRTALSDTRASDAVASPAGRRSARSQRKP
jgi:hypothetical protein